MTYWRYWKWKRTVDKPIPLFFRRLLLTLRLWQWHFAQLWSTEGHFSSNVKQTLTQWLLSTPLVISARLCTTEGHDSSNANRRWLDGCLGLLWFDFAVWQCDISHQNHPGCWSSFVDHRFPWLWSCLTQSMLLTNLLGRYQNYSLEKTQQSAPLQPMVPSSHYHHLILHVKQLEAGIVVDFLNRIDRKAQLQ